MIRPKTCTGLLAALSMLSFAGCAQENTNKGNTLEWTAYAKLGPWSVLRYTKPGAPSETLRCAAVSENIQGTALRVTADRSTYGIGVNGGSPDYGGTTVEMKLFADGQSDQSLALNGTYRDDPAFELDHWLGAEFQKNDKDVQHLLTATTVTVSTYNPGNRTGNDWPESHFEMYDGSELTSVLEACVNATSAPGETIIKDRPGGDCGNESALSGSGMCPSTARYLMHLPKGGPDKLAPGCQWSENDTKLSDTEFLVYKALQCGDLTSTLVPQSTGFPIELTALVAPTAAYTDGVGFETPDTWAEPVVTVFKYDENLSYLNEVPRLAKEAALAEGMSYSEGCQLEFDEFTGLESINDHNEPDFQSPNWHAPCGPLGAQEGYTVLWTYLRPGYVAAIHYPLDGFFGIAWTTMTVAKPDGNSGWQAR